MSSTQNNSNKKVVVVAQKPTGPLASTKEEADQLPLVAKIINHILTPGSSLSGMMLLFFNVIIFMLFTIWLMFVYVMPTSWIVWTFGFLGGGLALSTNYLLYQILFVVEEPKAEEVKEVEEGDAKKKEEEGEETRDDNNNESVAEGEKKKDVDENEPEASHPPAAGNANTSDGREGSLRKRKAKKEN